MQSNLWFYRLAITTYRNALIIHLLGVRFVSINFNRACSMLLEFKSSALFSFLLLFDFFFLDSVYLKRIVDTKFSGGSDIFSLRHYKGILLNNKPKARMGPIVKVPQTFSLNYLVSSFSSVLDFLFGSEVFTFTDTGSLVLLLTSINSIWVSIRITGSTTSSQMI